MGKITSNSFEDLSTDIQNKSERDTKKNCQVKSTIVMKIAMKEKIVTMNHHSY